MNIYSSQIQVDKLFSPLLRLTVILVIPGQKKKGSNNLMYSTVMEAATYDIETKEITFNCIVYLYIIHLFSLMYFTTIQRAMCNILPDLVIHIHFFKVISLNV